MPLEQPIKASGHLQVDCSPSLCCAKPVGCCCPRMAKAPLCGAHPPCKVSQRGCHHRQGLTPVGLLGQILYGNLAPEGCVGKITGKEGMLFEGPARVYDSEEDMLAALSEDPQSFKVGLTAVFMPAVCCF